MWAMQYVDCGMIVTIYVQYFFQPVRKGTNFTMDSPMCLIENDNGELSIVPEAINYLQKIRQHVVVVAVVGLYRTGKSYLMNKLAGKREGENLWQRQASRVI